MKCIRYIYSKTCGSSSIPSSLIENDHRTTIQWGFPPQSFPFPLRLKRMRFDNLLLIIQIRRNEEKTIIKMIIFLPSQSADQPAKLYDLMPHYLKERVKKKKKIPNWNEHIILLGCPINSVTLLHWILLGKIWKFRGQPYNKTKKNQKNCIWNEKIRRIKGEGVSQRKRCILVTNGSWSRFFFCKWCWWPKGIKRVEPS